MSYRILFLAPFPPRLDALHGGGRVIARLLCELGKEHQIALVHLRAEGEPGLDEATRSACELVEEVMIGPPRSAWRRRLTRLAKLWGAPPDRVARVRNSGFGDRARAVAETWRPDVIQVEYVEMAQHLPALDGLPAARVVVDHDPGAGAATDLSLATKGLRRLSRRLDVLAWDRFARHALARADRVVVFTDRDRLDVQSLVPRVPVQTIPIAVDVPPVALDPLGAQPPVVLFFGNYLHAPNADAALRLLQKIMPCVRTVSPETQLELVGEGPTEEMVRLARGGVRVTGAVPSLEPHLDAAAVVVCPIRIGGGIRVKVLEALAAGKAVVASPRAIEGVNVTHGREVLVADTDEEICASTVLLLADPARRAELARSARSWAERNLDHSLVAAAYERLYGQLRPGREAGLP